jgi:hypothetical protein
MANSPHPETVTVSFTLPHSLAAAVEQRAKASLTNKSDIIRRALLEFLSPAERAAVMGSVLNDGPNPNAVASKGPVNYRTTKPKKSKP